MASKRVLAEGSTVAGGNCIIRFANNYMLLGKESQSVIASIVS